LKYQTVKNRVFTAASHQGLPPAPALLQSRLTQNLDPSSNLHSFFFNDSSKMYKYEKKAPKKGVTFCICVLYVEPLLLF
jgi:hypothetical protein